VCPHIFLNHFCVQHNSQLTYVYTDQVQEIMSLWLSCTLDAFGYILLSLKSTKVWCFWVYFVYFALSSEMADKKKSTKWLHSRSERSLFYANISVYFKVTEIFKMVVFFIVETQIFNPWAMHMEIIKNGCKRDLLFFFHASICSIRLKIMLFALNILRNQFYVWMRLYGDWYDLAIFWYFICACTWFL
jgi:hypothetical protein